MASAQSFPSSPARPDTPNKHDHPYLIRTTSSSLLTRSNSIGSVHRPAPVITRSPASPALGRSQGRGHRHTKSHSSIAPPLPLPPVTPTSPMMMSNPVSPEKITPRPSPRRLKRSDTLPSFSTSKPTPSPVMEDLPSNPKIWTSTHLASYLSSALRVKGGGVLPRAVIKDIAGFIVERQLSGRAFLRLTQEDLQEMGINQLWRDSLLNASRTLRSNVLQGRIWGFGQHGEKELHSFPSTVFEENGDARGGIKSISRGTISRVRSGKVKNIIAGFERSASSASSDSGMDADSPLSDAQALPSPLPYEDSDGAITSGSEVDHQEVAGYDSFNDGHSQDLDVEGADERSFTDSISLLAESADSLIHAESDGESAGSIVLHTPPPVYAEKAVLQDTPVGKEQEVLSITNLQAHGVGFVEHTPQDSGSEDTMENLITNLSQTSSWGAKAWEEVEDMEPGSTRRRIPESSDGSNNNDVSSSPSHDLPIRPQPASLVALFEPPPLPVSKAQEHEAEARERDRRNQALLSELRIRLEEVERRLDEMEARERELEQVQHVMVSTATTISSNQEMALGERMLDGLGEESPKPEGELSSTCDPSEAHSGPLHSIESAALSREITKVQVQTGVQFETENEDPYSNDPSPSGLPSYVFLVGVGVCAVIIRVVIRKMVGRKP